jgi:hypothetical protein
MYFPESLLLAFLLGTWIAVPVALVILIKRRKLRVAGLFSLALLLGPLLLRLIMNIDDAHLRIWVAMPLMIFVPGYLLLGFWICVSAVDALSEKMLRTLQSSAPNKRIPFQMNRRRYFGICLLAFGVCAWFYGATHPQLTSGVQAAVAGLALYPLLIGGVWLVTGEKLWR